jgi:hypothetical protein
MQQQATSITRRFLADNLSICPILNGLWQVSGGHGTIDYTKALEAVHSRQLNLININLSPKMHSYVQDGYTTFDGADHYGPGVITCCDLVLMLI